MTVFISYCHEDAETARALASGLIAANVKVWQDVMRIREGDQLEARIFEGIRESRLFVVLVSNDTAASKWVCQETELAVQLENAGKLEVVPVLLDHGATLAALNDRLFFDGCAGLGNLMDGLVARALAAASPPAAGQRVSDDARCFTHHNRQIGSDHSGRAVLQLDIVSFDLDAPYSILTQFTFLSTAPAADLPDEASRALANRVLRACARSFAESEWRVKLRRDETVTHTFTVVDALSGLTFNVVGRSLRLGNVDRGTVLFNVGALFELILPDGDGDE